jgi:hypothetical protein
VFWTWRSIAGFLGAVGLFAWLALWFEKSFWLGAAQAAFCGLYVAAEIGLIRPKK